MKQEPVKIYDLSVLDRKYAGKWVALSPDYRKVLSSGDSLKSLLKKLQGPDKIVLKVLPRVRYIPAAKFI